MNTSQNVAFTRRTIDAPASKAGDEQAWHVLPFEAVKDRLQTDVERGLTQAEAA